METYRVHSVPNPIESITKWMTGVGHGRPQLMLYEGLVTEEMAETFDEYRTHFKGSSQGHNDHKELAALMHKLALTMRKDLDIVVTDRAKLLDAHLDSVWVHLGAAMALLGGGDEGAAKLALAWSRLHKANVTDKQVDGKYVLDASGKVQKPPGHQQPDYADLFEVRLVGESEGGEL